MIDVTAQYDPSTYHCVHYAVDAWKALTGVDLSHQFAPAMGEISEATARRSMFDGFAEVEIPDSPCFVLMRRKHKRHLGVYIDGKILHLTRNGVHAIAPTVLRLQYESLRYYKCAK